MKIILTLWVSFNGLDSEKKDNSNSFQSTFAQKLLELSFFQ